MMKLRILLALLGLSVGPAALGAEAPGATAAALPLITVYKSPTCGCCSKWVDHLKANGFEVKAVETSDLSRVKAFYGIDPKMQSCHTADVGRFVIEGHVPADDIKRLLREDPADVNALAVPGMPMGSPGMEGPRKDDYTVFAIDKQGQPRAWAQH